jgi:hypothetical protein
MMAYRSPPTIKIMVNLEKTNFQEIPTVKTRLLGDSNFGRALRTYLQTHDNHCMWHWEQTGTSSMVKNMYLLGEHWQKHYGAQFTRHQIKVNRKDVLHKGRPTLHRYPISMQQSMSTTLVFARPHKAYNNFNLYKPKLVIICNPYRVAMLKHVKYQPVPQEDMESVTQHTIIIGVTSKQWGA